VEQFAIPPSDFHDVPKEREDGFDAKALLDELSQWESATIFAVCQDDTRMFWSKAIEPVQEVRLSRMGAEPAEAVGFGADGDSLAEHVHFGGPFREQATQ
jgi:hypothetical protein